MFTIRPRAAWSIGKPRTALTHAQPSWTIGTTDVFVHHTADHGPDKNTVDGEHAYLRHIESFHVQTRGYAAIGYSYIIMPSGRVYEGRGWNRKGAHTLDPKDADSDGKLVENDDIGICFAGTFTKKPPTRRARLAYRMLLRRLRHKGVRIDKTYGHRHAFATSCPGDAIVKWLKL